MTNALKEGKLQLPHICLINTTQSKHTTNALLSESQHHLTPSNVTSKLTTLPHHRLTTSDLNFFNFGALPNFLHYITLLLLLAGHSAFSMMGYCHHNAVCLSVRDAVHCG